MFWRLGLQSSSTLDTLLARENPPPTIDELLDEQDLLSEIKGGNVKLIQILSTTNNVKALFHWLSYGTEDIDSAEVIRWRRAEDIYDKQLSGISPSSSIINDVTKPIVKDQEEEDLSIWKGSVGFDATTSPGAAVLALNEDVGTRNVGQGQRGEDIGRNAEEEKDEARRLRFSQIATEILTSEIQSVIETTSSNLTPLMTSLWDSILPPCVPGPSSLACPIRSSSDREDFFVLDDDVLRRAAGIRHIKESLWDEGEEQDEKRRELIRGNWMRVCGVYMGWKTSEMITFIRSMPNVIERMVDKIESPAVQDMLLRIVACEEAGVAGTVKWLQSQNFVPRLLALLSPYHDPSLHTTVGEVLKHIIGLSALSPFNPAGGNAIIQQQVMTSPQGDVSFQGQQQQSQQQQQQQPQSPQTPPGHRDNRLIRELVGKDCVDLLIGFIIDNVQYTDVPKTTDSDGISTPKVLSPSTPPNVIGANPYDMPPSPSIASATSSLCNSINVLIELIRKNNSDFSEPHLFHTMRNRLISLQQKQQEERKEVHRPEAAEETEEDKEKRLQADREEEDRIDEAERAQMENVMKEMSEKMGIVHLGELLEAFSTRIENLQELLARPRSINLSKSPSMAEPLTLERLRIVELYAELLHCSNMSILNRAQGKGPRYSVDGCLIGGLSALEDLGRALESDNADAEEESLEEVKPSRELPVSSSSTDCISVSSDEPPSSNSMDVDDVEDQGNPAGPDIKLETLDHVPTALDTPRASAIDIPLTPPPPSDADAARLMDVMATDPRLRRLAAGEAQSETASVSNVAVASVDAESTTESDDGDAMKDVHVTEAMLDEPTTAIPVGDRLKRTYIETGVLPTVMSLFFDFPLNNFLHNVVYDIVQQVLSGQFKPSTSQNLIVAIFTRGKLVEHILDAQRLNDTISSNGKATRLGFMGHLTLLAEEVSKFLETSPAHLRTLVEESFVLSEWESFCDGPLRETRERDAKPLAGSKPRDQLPRPSAESDRQDSDSDDDEGALAKSLTGAPLTRTPAHAEEDFSKREDGDVRRINDNQFSRYLMRETHPGNALSSDEDSDDSTGSPQVSPATRAAAHASFDGFDDAFPAGQEFDDDEAWGNFATAPTASASVQDPFGDEFAPSSSTLPWTPQAPVTSAGFAQQAFQNWTQQEDQQKADVSSDSIHMPEAGNDSLDEAYDFVVRNWSIPGDIEAGEKMPPATSPVTSPVLQDFTDSAKRLTLDTIPKSPRLTFEDLPTSPVLRRARSRTSSTSSGHSPHVAAAIAASWRGEAISPPDPSLLEATSPDEPFGHGVSPDVKLREDGLLSREIDGKIILVPQDEIASAAVHRRNSIGSSNG